MEGTIAHLGLAPGAAVEEAGLPAQVAAGTSGTAVAQEHLAAGDCAARVQLPACKKQRRTVLNCKPKSALPLLQSLLLSP